jgi:hypothetical protein
MSNKIVTSFLNTPLTLLLIILIILIIFCIMHHKIYNLQSIMYDDDNDDKKNIIDQELYKDKIYNKHKYHNKNDLEYIFSEDNSIKIKENILILNDIIKKSNLEIDVKENFDPLTQDDLNKQNMSLKELELIINNFNTTSLPLIKNVIDNVTSQKTQKKDELLKVLNNIYTLRYIDIINQQNAASYHEYNKYIAPKKNIFYKQYL